MNALVSAVVPAFNAARTIERALDSIARQTYSPIEIIVVDDASSDDTAEIVRTWSGGRARCIVQASNGGAARARNIGIQAARGEYVAFLDADDEWRPAKIEAQIAAIARDPRITLVGCDGTWLAEDGTVLPLASRRAPPVTGPDGWKALLAYSFVATPCVLTRRATLSDLGGFDESLVVGEDQDLWIRLAMSGHVAWADADLVVIHSVAGSLMKANVQREAEFVIPMIRRHVAASAGRLSRTETRAILGRRYSRIGRNLYAAGSHWRGADLLVRAIGLGYEPFSNLLYLVLASPPGLRMKNALKSVGRLGRSRGSAISRPR